MREAALNPDLPFNNLLGFLTQNGVRVIDLLPDFQRQARETKNLYLRSDGHWTDAGHDLAADVIAGRVQLMLNRQPVALGSGTQN